MQRPPISKHALRAYYLRQCCRTDGARVARAAPVNYGAASGAAHRRERLFETFAAARTHDNMSAASSHGRTVNGVVDGANGAVRHRQVSRSMYSRTFAR